MSTWELKNTLTIDTSSRIKKVGAKKFTPTYRKILKISVPYSGFIFV